MSLLFVCATDLEMAPLRSRLAGRDDAELLVSGVGLVESACTVSSFLTANQEKIRVVINFGVAGAYPGSGAGLLDICLAEKEVLGDFGLCFADHIEPFDRKNMMVKDVFPLSERLLRQAEQLFIQKKTDFKKGIFVTVNCASATAKRGAMLAETHQGLLENMEGAAIAGACRLSSLPLLELRCVSNMVEDRDPGAWRLAEACEKSAAAASCLAGHL